MLNPLTIKLKADEPRDINDSLGLLCRYLKLDKSVEESKCVIGNAKRVDYNILLRFCVRHELVFKIDFKTMDLAVTFTPLTMNIASDDEILEEERILAEMKASKDAHKIKKAKKEPVKKASEILNEIPVPEEKQDDMSFLDDIEDDEFDELDA